MVKEHTLVVVGSGGVGKSAITVQFLYNQFMTFYDPTIEESYRKQVVIDEVACMLNIVDTAGQEEYATLRDQYWGPGEGFVLVYSITSKETFVEVQDLAKLVLRTKDATNFPMCIIGNKKDLEHERKVPTSDGENLARDLRCPFFETSAKTRLNVDECFTALVREIWKSSNDSPVEGGKTKKKGCTLL
eukprot:GILI01008487.1.p1 GENE.GILI01008487.1~~GILI01008487.1.p1  ORF type:complete len:188 (-),score=43.19 GILI01008487.1:107-670(-)